MTKAEQQDLKTKLQAVSSELENQIKIVHQQQTTIQELRAWSAGLEQVNKELESVLTSSREAYAGLLIKARVKKAQIAALRQCIEHLAVIEP